MACRDILSSTLELQLSDTLSESVKQRCRWSLLGQAEASGLLASSSVPKHACRFVRGMLAALLLEKCLQQLVDITPERMHMDSHCRCHLHDSGSILQIAVDICQAKCLLRASGAAKALVTRWRSEKMLPDASPKRSAIVSSAYAMLHTYVSVRYNPTHEQHIRGQEGGACRGKHLEGGFMCLPPPVDVLMRIAELAAQVLSSFMHVADGRIGLQQLLGLLLLMHVEAVQPRLRGCQLTLQRRLISLHG